MKVTGRGRAVAGYNDAVNCFSRAGRRLAGAEVGRRRSLRILLVCHRSGGGRDMPAERDGFGRDEEREVD